MARARMDVESATERALAALWSEMLSVSGVGPGASFIELGGDSITAARCINRIQDAFGCDIPYGAFLEPEMTLRKLAALVDEASRPPEARAAGEQVSE